MPTRAATGLLTALSLLLTSCGTSREQQNDFAMRPTGAAVAAAQYEANLRVHGDDPGMLVLPGLLADREARTVEVLAEATGLGAEELVEFLLVDRSSGHGYEALLFSQAKPSSVHRALEFVGLAPGTPVDPEQLRFWATGPPVALRVRLDGESEPLPIESLVLDATTGEPLPEAGFVFTGSFRLPPRGEQLEERYAADARQPRAIAAVYNERTAVLDVPGKVGKSEIYGKLVVNPARPLAAGTLLTVVMTPGDPRGRLRAPQLQLTMDHAEDGAGFVYRLRDAAGALRRETNEPTPMLEELVAQWSERGAPYLDLRFGARLPLRDVSMTCVLMAKLAAMNMVRIDPPAADQLYYKAFVPDRAWATPKTRPGQPWELHLRPPAGATPGELVLHEPVLDSGEGADAFTRHVRAVAAPDDVKVVVERAARAAEAAGERAPPPVLLVYAPGSMLYGELMAFVRPVQDTHRTVFVFLRQGSK